MKKGKLTQKDLDELIEWFESLTPSQQRGVFASVEESLSLEEPEDEEEEY